MNFLRRNLQWVIVALCVVIFGAVYLFERYKPAAVFSAVKDEPASEVIQGQSTVTESPGLTQTPEPETAGLIKVYITGAVVNPGVYEVSSDARVNDVLSLAGGASSDADLPQINLAAHVSDAERIVVPDVHGNFEAASEAAAGSGDTAAPSGGLININTADSAALQTLPGIGPVLAEGIILYRETNGSFKAIEEIKEVSRIGDATFAQIKDLITVS